MELKTMIHSSDAINKNDFKQNHSLIGTYMHCMYIAVSNDNSIEFLKSFILFKHCIKRQFVEEDRFYLIESNTFNYYHKLMHKSFIIDLNGYEQSLGNSNQKRLEVLIKIKEWYVNHLGEFDVNINTEKPALSVAN